MSQNAAWLRLTPRETEVAKLMAEGFPMKEVAWKLQISVKTVQKHADAAYKKLNVHSVVDLAHLLLMGGQIENKFAVKQTLAELETANEQPKSRGTGSLAIRNSSKNHRNDSRAIRDSRVASRDHAGLG